MRFKHKAIGLISSLLLVASAFASSKYNFNIMNETFSDMKLYRDNSVVTELGYGNTEISKEELLNLCKDTYGNCRFEIDSHDEIQSVASIVFDLEIPAMWVLPHSSHYSVRGSTTDEGFMVRIS